MRAACQYLEQRRGHRPSANPVSLSLRTGFKQGWMLLTEPNGRSAGWTNPMWVRGDQRGVLDPKNEGSNVAVTPQKVLAYRRAERARQESQELPDICLWSHTGA